jgi:hypothetical protein|tara:strand:- start:42491 stop:42649 length:159 start_codon:yes stop_codon:yes gene_type:complete
VHRERRLTAEVSERELSVKHLSSGQTQRVENFSRMVEPGKDIFKAKIDKQKL